MPRCFASLWNVSHHELLWAYQRVSITTFVKCKDYSVQSLHVNVTKATKPFALTPEKVKDITQEILWRRLVGKEGETGEKVVVCLCSLHDCIGKKHPG